MTTPDGHARLQLRRAVTVARVDDGLLQRGALLGQHVDEEILDRCREVSWAVDVRIVLVHATDDDAVAFYARSGFVPSPVDPLTMMMLRTVDETTLSCRAEKTSSAAPRNPAPP